MNRFKTFLLMLVLTVLLVIVGSAIGGRSGAVYAFIFAALMNFFSYWFSDKIVLRMYGAKEVTQSEAPQLYGIVAELTSKASLPMPKVYIMENETPNAFATGRNPEHAAVAVTTGIMRILSKEELMGVIGHELSHIQHRDILISTIAATMAGAISMLATMARWGAMFGGVRSDDEEGGGGGNILVVLFVSIFASICGHADPDGHFSFKGILCRRGRGPPEPSPFAGQGPWETGNGFAAHSHAGQPFDGPHVHRQSIERRRGPFPLQHPSPDRGADCQA